MPNTASHHYKKTSLLFGLLAALSIEGLNFPQGVGAATLSIIALLSLCHALRKTKGTDAPPLWLYPVTVFTLIISASLAVNSNTLTISVSWLAIFHGVSLLWLTLADVELCGFTYPIALGRQIRVLVKDMFNFSRFRSLFSPLFRAPNISQEIRNGIVIAIPIVTVFHFFFVSINKEYSAFVDNIFFHLLSFLQFLIDLGVVTTLLTFILYALTLFNLLNPTKTSLKQPTIRIIRYEIITIVTGSLVLLFLIFSFFQGKIIFSDLAALCFEELSLYVESGFWELLAVGLLGYFLLTTFIRSSNASKKEEYRFAPLLFKLFATQLLLIAIFGYHKLHYYQSNFGLKDQRILATLATVLVAASFVLLILSLFKKISAHGMFGVQSFLFTMLLAILAVSNVDSFLTKTNPISFYHNGKRYKDYSYLLTNSYDNGKYWLPLMKEVISEENPEPIHYYRGKFVSLCGRNQTIRESHFLPIKKHILSLLNKYSAQENRYDIRKLAQFRLNEYRTYLEVEGNLPEINQFLAFLESNCRENKYE